jgi:hypothetical protein
VFLFSRKKESHVSEDVPVLVAPEKLQAILSWQPKRMKSSSLRVKQTWPGIPALQFHDLGKIQLHSEPQSPLL